MEGGEVSRSIAGTPQGGVISPLLSNIYLHVLDTMWKRDGAQYGTLVRYADDFVVMCTTREGVRAGRQKRVRTILTRLGLELHPEKTRTVRLFDGEEGFDFLGCHLHKRLSGRDLGTVATAALLPESLAVATLDEADPATREGADPASRDATRISAMSIASLSIRFSGAGATTSARATLATCFNQVDSYVWRRLNRLLIKRKGRQLQAGRVVAKMGAAITSNSFGLHRLRGTVRYPEAA